MIHMLSFVKDNWNSPDSSSSELFHIRIFYIPQVTRSDGVLDTDKQRSEINKIFKKTLTLSYNFEEKSGSL